MESGLSMSFHIFSVVVAVFIPLIPALRRLEDGFLGIGLPTFFCLGREKGYVYYTLSLPTSLIGVVSTTAVILAFWRILKVVRYNYCI